MHLQTQRLHLKSIESSHAKEVFAYRSDAETNKYQGWIPKTIQEVHDFIGLKVCKTIDMADTWHQLVIVTKKDNTVIGDIGIHFFDADKKQVEFGCTLAKSKHKKGYATEALTEIIRFLFGDLNKHRITASIDPENTKSIEIAERLGFRKEAHFRKSIFIDGQWVDDLVFAILKEEWEENNWTVE